MRFSRPLLLLIVLVGSACSRESSDTPPATQFVVSDLGVLPPEEGMDLDGDGTVDNVVGLLGISEQGVNSLLRSMVQDGTFLLLAELSGMDSPDDDSALGFAFYQGVDPDGGPENHLGGDAELLVDPASLDGSGEPLYSGSGEIAGGVVSVAMDTFSVLGFFQLEGVRLLADGGGRLRSLSEGVLAGAMPAGALASVDAGSGRTGLDMLVVNYELAADLDEDGDGLEVFTDTDGDGRVDRCTDGDGTPVDGTACAQDPRFRDAFSMALGLEAVPCVIVGVAEVGS